MSARRVIVVGAGPGGCATALALHRIGIDTEVWEKHPESTEDRGAFLGLVSTGVVALRELGVLDAVDRRSSLLTTFRQLGLDGTVLIERPAGGGGPEALRMITRQHLCDELQAAVRAAHIPIHWATAPTGVTHHEGRIEVASDASDATTTADLMVAADGLSSTWRAHINPDDEPPRYVGQNIFYGRSSWAPATPGPRAFTTVVADGWAFGYIETSVDTWWFARLTRGRQDERKPDFSVLADALSGLPTAIVEQSTHRWMLNGYDLPAVTRWYRDGVLLLGDAAHAASPATGQGASTAFEDGIVLARALRDRPDVGAAVRSYEAVRRGRTQANIVASAAASTPHAPLTWADQGRAPSAEELHAQLSLARPLDAEAATCAVDRRTRVADVDIDPTAADP